tara:strand:- start:100273 stop:101388 length:1116 start_codon:yes stop_codon:yes gene_type:complete
MSDSLKQLDKSKNMEDLRSARSFNEIVVVLSRIKNAASSINSKLSRKLEKVQTSEVEIPISEQQEGEFSLDRSSLKASHEDLESLQMFTYQLHFARSISGVVSSDAKMEKFRKLCEQLDAVLIKTQNMAFKYLNAVGSRVEPARLGTFASRAEKYLAKLTDSSRVNSFVVPDAAFKVSFTHYVVVHNVPTQNGYVLSELLVALHADNNYDNTFSYSISFPDRVGDASERFTISNPKQLTRALDTHLFEGFEIQTIGELESGSKRYIETMPNVLSTYVDDNNLVIELESGVTGSDVNSVLTKLLPCAHTALGVSDPRTDIVHRVAQGPRGNKTIRIQLSDRNFYNQGAFKQLRKMLALDSRTYKAVMSATKG